MDCSIVCRYGVIRSGDLNGLALCQKVGLAEILGLFGSDVVGSDKRQTLLFPEYQLSACSMPAL
jgi:hypothetical protein